MGAKHITAQEKELFKVLVNTGLSMRKVARLTGRTAGTVSDHLSVSDSKQVISNYLTQDEMFRILDLHAQGMTCTQISAEVDKAHGTVYKVINQLYPKHKKAHAKWLEMQGQAEAQVVPVVPPALAAIRAARKAGLTMTKQEESPALVMEVQTVENDVVSSQTQETPERPDIDWQAKWCEAQQQIAELREINSILKGYVRHLQRLNEQ